MKRVIEALRFGVPRNHIVATADPIQVPGLPGNSGGYTGVRHCGASYGLFVMD